MLENYWVNHYLTFPNISCISHILGLCFSIYPSRDGFISLNPSRNAFLPTLHTNVLNNASMELIIFSFLILYGYMREFNYLIITDHDLLCWITEYVPPLSLDFRLPKVSLTLFQSVDILKSMGKWGFSNKDINDGVHNTFSYASSWKQNFYVLKRGPGQANSEVSPFFFFF